MFPGTRINTRIAALFALAVFFVFVSASGTKEGAVLILEAERGNRPLPVLTQQYPDLSIEDAYDIQAEYVRLKLGGDKIAGYKAGLTSKAAQEKFVVDTPVSGVLFSSGTHESTAVIEGSKFRSLVIETEIGFVAGKRIEEKIIDIARLREYIGAVLPVIELPETGFADMKKIKAQDIVAANVGSAVFITGARRPLADADPDDITVKLVSDGETLNQGKGSDALGGQWEALLWLVNSAIGNGWKIERGDILITGALGKVVPAKPGRYQAQFGELGDISFDIK
ncbi:MAG: fumarylacetoacetate hydrolase family protein [Thermodesulfobacteriota bacterium]